MKAFVMHLLHRLHHYMGKCTDCGYSLCETCENCHTWGCNSYTSPGADC